MPVPRHPTTFRDFWLLTSGPEDPPFCYIETIIGPECTMLLDTMAENADAFIAARKKVCRAILSMACNVIHPHNPPEVYHQQLAKQLAEIRAQATK